MNQEVIPGNGDFWQGLVQNKKRVPTVQSLYLGFANEKSISPLFPGPEGAWLQMTVCLTELNRYALSNTENTTVYQTVKRDKI